MHIRDKFVWVNLLPIWLLLKEILDQNPELPPIVKTSEVFLSVFEGTLTEIWLGISENETAGTGILLFFPIIPARYHRKKEEKLYQYLSLVMPCCWVFSYT
jgi:hypothetical protein